MYNYNVSKRNVTRNRKEVFAQNRKLFRKSSVKISFSKEMLKALQFKSNVFLKGKYKTLSFEE